MPSAVPASTRLAAQSAAAKLRERADALHPDEDLAASIAANADAGDAFARGYGALKEIGLEDKLLDRFATENATGSEMRQAADVLDQLAQSEDVPGPGRKRGEARVSKSFVRRFRVAAILTALLCGLPIMLFGGVFLVRGSLAAREWWDARDAPNVVARPERAAPPAPALAPVAQGFEATKEGKIVPPKPRDYVADRAGILDPAAARALNGRLLQFERETSNQLVVFVDRRVPPGTTLEELSAASIRHWGVGQEGKDNGAILFVFVDDRKMRIEVGYGLESVLTDARSKRIT
ncbi:MAG: TPM domain-containing protein, partial [Acidobacteriota bacterium]